MLHAGKMTALFELLEKMAKKQSSLSEEISAAPWVRRTDPWFFYLTLVTLTPLIILAAWNKWGATDCSKAGYYAVYYLFIAGKIIGALYSVSMAWEMMWDWRQRHIVNRTRLSCWDAKRDADNIKALRTYPKCLLEYALLKCRYQWGTAETRVTLFVGDFRKLHLLPVVWTLIITGLWQKLLDISSNPWWWWLLLMMVIAIGGVYLVVYVVGPGARRKHVLELLQYAIAHTKDREPVAKKAAAVEIKRAALMNIDE